ncbi:HD domain-containing protein [Actinorugispora endophytica]|uniref:HD domain-containing protein n=1 Tax=Actinorugispora endophytica TaxID=1605990 RepID=A0A4R6UZU5_9ACTN|nr:HD domain-containing protein [Actinorugispora endophytica]TDQ53004.1 HD domain-containing protein [Actinorugispora endophytica]
MGDVLWARDLARRLLEDPSPRRWAHTRGVAERAESLSALLGDDTDLVTAAAWLHDIGYSPALAATGFHPLDGARYLRDTEKADERLYSLVAHHSGAWVEAGERGLRDELVEEFAFPPANLLDALTYSDMTTGLDGTRLSLERRLSEILECHTPGGIVHRSISQSMLALTASVRAVEGRLNRVG